jgi:hypothetical protein
MRSRSRYLAVLSALVLAFTRLTFGQAATTSLHGTVTDAKGAVVVGAAINLSDPATGLSRSATTND